MDINNLHESALVAMATEAKRPTRWWLAYLVSVVGAIMIVGLIVTTLVDQVFPTTPGSISAQLRETAIFLGAFGALALWVRFKEGRPVRSLGFRGAGALQRFLIGVGIGAGLLTISVLMLVLLGQYRPVEGPAGSVSGLAAAPLVLLMVVAHWAIQSSTEETLMRGYQVQMGALQLPGWLAILLPGVLFSLLHMSEVGLGEPVAIVNILLFALFGSFIALRQGSLWMICGIHTGWNWFQGNVFGVPVSGITPYLTSLFRFGPTEGAAHFVSGGNFGPEGSLVVSVVWGITTFMAYRYFASGRPSSVKARSERTQAR
jgi:hypothetical protein